MKRIAVFSGGDAWYECCHPCSCSSSNFKGMEVFGIYDGYAGMVGKIQPLTHLLRYFRGGTFSSFSRYPEFAQTFINKGIEQLKKHGIEGVVVIGGDVILPWCDA